MSSVCRSWFVACATVMVAWWPCRLAAEDDWRLELFKYCGILDNPKELKGMVAEYDSATAGLDGALKDLASEDYRTRQRARELIRLAGPAALPWIKNLPPQDDPEVRFHLKDLEDRLHQNADLAEREMMEYAVRSIWEERTGKAQKGGPMPVFYEWFFAPQQKPLVDKFGLFVYQADKGMTGFVKDGEVHFNGNHEMDGDQALILNAGSIGWKVFPEKLRISCQLGGSGNDGAGAWHVGISIGRVRVLYHPGMKDGAFRIETTTEKKALCENKSMGFNPEIRLLQRMEITAKVIHGDVLLDVRISGPNVNQFFRHQQLVPGNVIGPLDSVGLWRSGRRGADAIFKKFILDLRP